MDYFSPPEDLYGLAIAEPLQLDRVADGNLVFFIEYIRVFLLLLTNYVVQCAFMTYVGKIVVKNYTDEDNWVHCVDELWTTQFTCVFVFMIAVFADIRESFDMFQGIVYSSPGDYGALHLVGQKRQSDSPDSHRHVNVASHMMGGVAQHNSPDIPHRHGALFEREDTEEQIDKAEEGMFAKAKHWFKRKKRKQHGPHQWNLDRLTPTLKVLMVLLVVAPKTLICCGLFFLGSEFIIVSPDGETLILNTMAVLFILEINEYLYHSFTSSIVKARLATCKVVAVEMSNTNRVMGWVASNFIVPPFIISVAYFMVEFNHRYSCSVYQ